MLEKIYAMERERQRTEPMTIQPGPIEVCASVERALNYMITGHAKVIATGLMNPMWIGHSVMQDGLPCFNPRLVKFWKDLSKQRSTLKLKIGYEDWPMDKRGLICASASKRTQIFNYGENHFAVSERLIC